MVFVSDAKKASCLYVKQTAYVFNLNGYNKTISLPKGVNTNPIIYTTQKTIRKMDEIILDIISQYPSIGRKELATKIENITEYGVKYHINKLKKEDKLKRIGPDKGGYWEVIE